MVRAGLNERFDVRSIDWLLTERVAQLLGLIEIARSLGPQCKRPAKLAGLSLIWLPDLGSNQGPTD